MEAIGNSKITNTLFNIPPYSIKSLFNMLIDSTDLPDNLMEPYNHGTFNGFPVFI